MIFKIIHIRTAATVAAVCLLCGFALCLMLSLLQDEAVPTLSDEKICVVIDPGHGGQDGGASSGDVLEKDLNLAVALALRDKLEGLGFAVAMTRDGDLAPGIDDKYIKKQDLAARLGTIKSSDADIFVSIHMNNFSDSKYSGAQVFCADDDESGKLGEAIQKSLRDDLDPDNTRNVKGNERGIYILKNAGVPAVLVECGFLSNKDECEKLQNAEYQEKCADAIAAGITEYIDLIRC